MRSLPVPLAPRSDFHLGRYHRLSHFGAMMPKGEKVLLGLRGVAWVGSTNSFYLAVIAFALYLVSLNSWGETWDSL